MQISAYFSQLQHVEALTEAEVCDDISCHERPPFQDIGTIRRTEGILLDLLYGELYLASDLDLPVVFQTRITERTSKELASSAVKMRIRYCEDAGFFGWKKRLVES